jgi:hypothetical protein
MAEQVSDRYGRLSDHLYRFIRDLASREDPGWGEREDIEMAIRFIKRLEALHEKEEEYRKCAREVKRHWRRTKKRADVVSLVTTQQGKVPA